MAATQTGNNTLLTSGSSAAGATTNSATLTLSGAGYTADITIQITNGATPPTTPCVATLQFSPDNTNWYASSQAISGDLTASSVTVGDFFVPFGVLYARVQFKGHTGQAVTVAAQSGLGTGL